MSHDLASLASQVRAVDPTARLAPRRIVRRVIRWQYGLKASENPPHDLCFEVDRGTFLGCVSASDVGETDATIPERILLLPCPEPDDHAPRIDVLLDLWRRLFHAAIDRAIDRKGGWFADDPALYTATVRHEIMTVLRDEHRLPPTEDPAMNFREFAAFFLELHYFAPHELETYFPGFLDAEAVARQLDDKYQAQSLFNATRLPDAPDPSAHAPTELGAHPATPTLPIVADAPRIEKRAAAAATAGNDVRAAISYRQCGRVVEAEERLTHLVNRLKKALRFSEAERQPWQESLRPLLRPASVGFWPVAGRLLYELQKACHDEERKLFSVDLIEYAITLGKQPLRRLIDKPREVNILRRLRRALKLSTRVSITDQQSELLERLLQDAIHKAERRVRLVNRPYLLEVLDEVGLRPQNPPEKIARNKVIDELLDGLCARGFIKMTDLRDAIARNQLKLHDLSGPKELLLGDPILRANSLLAVRMDGLYKRGEIYMRALQRGSSLAFGTYVGRFVTLFAVLPFFGAFIVLGGLHHFVELLTSITHFIARTITGAPPPPPNPAGHAHAESWMTSWPAIAIFGIFLIGMIHLPAFRKQVARVAFFVLDILGRVISFIWDYFLDNAASRFFIRHLLTPFLAGGTAVFLMRLSDHEWEPTVLVGAGAVMLTASFFRTPLGRGLEERFDETISRVWRILSVNFLLGALTWILWFFRIVFELIEKGIYAVDEWLRFREGENSLSVAFKLVFGMVWFFLAYIFRFAWNLLIEPQINPIKHFPVVTVSHKLILPLALTSNATVPSPLAELILKIVDTTPQTANAVASTIVFGIPGIFGFLVWELKENWKLYRANRPKNLEAVAVGSHGEHVRGLLRPGFHSGVVPKTYAKLRRAESAHEHVKAAKHHHHLEHIAEAIQRLAERVLLATLKASERWDGLPLRIAETTLAVNRLRIILTIEGWLGHVVISIEERGGWLIGSLEKRGWLDKLSVTQRAAFDDTVLAIFKLAGVHVLREEAAAVLDVRPYRLDCRPEGLLVLPEGPGEAVAIDYDDRPAMKPSGLIDGRLLGEIPTDQLLFSHQPLAWDLWVDRWQQDAEGKMPAGPLLKRE